MADARNMEMVKPYHGDPFVGHLSTPISDSAFTRAFIGNLPAYRKGLSPSYAVWKLAWLMVTS